MFQILRHTFFSTIGSWVPILLLIGFGCLCIKIGDIIRFFKRKALYSRIKKEKCNKPETNNLKKLFTVSSREIMTGEGIVPGKTKLSLIKDAPARVAAQNDAEMSFHINTQNGKVYKVLKFRDNENTYYYTSNYKELNHYLIMNESAFKKYKNITEENWHNVCK